MKEAECLKKPKSLQQQALEGIESRRKPSVGLRMTPMIDVIFLLLTFFIITAKFRKPEAFLPIALPTADSVQSLRSRIVEPLILEIKSRGGDCVASIGGLEEILLAAESPESGLASLAESLAEVCRSQQRTSSDPIELICADEVTWDYVVKIYDVLQAMGASNITFLTIEQGYEETH